MFSLCTQTARMPIRKNTVDVTYMTNPDSHTDCIPCVLQHECWWWWMGCAADRGGLMGLWTLIECGWNVNMVLVTWLVSIGLV